MLYREGQSSARLPPERLLYTCITNSTDNMGRRKSNRKPPPKRKAIMPLDIQFDCPFCNHEKSCDVMMDRARYSARIVCRVCMEDYQTKTNFLTEPVDIYNDWIDACEKAN